MKSTSKLGSLDMEATDVAMEVCVCVLYGRAVSSAGVSKDVRESACSYGERGSEPDEEDEDGREGRRLGSFSKVVNVLSKLCDGSTLDVFGMAACFSWPGAIVEEVEGEDERWKSRSFKVVSCEMSWEVIMVYNIIGCCARVDLTAVR